MEYITAIKDRIPDYAKDIRLNLDAVLARSSLEANHAAGAALAAAFAAKSKPLIDAIRTSATLDPAHAHAALTAASLMGVNNIWYPYLEMAADADLKTVRPELRMNAYATHGGVDRSSFELYALAASIVGKCEFCVQSHYKLLRESGMSTQQLRDVGRIAGVINAAAQVIAAESEVVAA